MQTHPQILDDLISFVQDQANLLQHSISFPLTGYHGPEIVMDEEIFELELGDLDISGIEEACAQKSFHSITPKQIQLLIASLYKVK